MLTFPLPSSSSFDWAARRTIAALLNCYVREYAAPQDQVGLYEEPVSALPRPLRELRAGRATPLLRIGFPRLRQACLIAVEPRPRGAYRFCSEPYALASASWSRVLDWKALASLVIQELSESSQQPFNQELLEQIGDSCARMQQFYAYHPPVRDFNSVVQGYLHSEQALTAGHSHHPAPKAREGLSDEALFRYSPELGARFSLYAFAVAPERLQSYDRRGQAGLAQTVQALGRWLGHSEPVLAIHPWQAEYLLSRPGVQRAIRRGDLTPLGPTGPEWHATASVRTLFHPEFPYFLKQSLHVRLTNCLRKNAWYELESAPLLDGLLDGLEHPFPRFTLLSEPGYSSLDLADEEPQERRFLREAFSTLFRDSRPVLESGRPVYSAAGLFGGTADGALLERVLQLYRRRHPSATLSAWLRDYCRAVVWPALYFFCEHGVVFEPHLQNTLVSFDGGRPCGGVLRDLEGTKLRAAIWQDRLPAGLDEQVRSSILYDEGQAWRRFVYCILFNQLAEVVEYLDELPSAELWQQVRASLLDYQQAHGSAASQPWLTRLLSEPRLPVKANLITRFRRDRDRDATYLEIPNPLV